MEENGRTLELEELGDEEEKPRKERDDWGGPVTEGESVRQRRGNWRVKEKRLRGLGLKRLKERKDGSRGEERGGVRPS